MALNNNNNNNNTVYRLWPSRRFVFKRKKELLSLQLGRQVLFLLCFLLFWLFWFYCVMRRCLAPFTVSKQSKSCSFCLCCFALAFVFLPFYFRCFTPFILFVPLIHHVPHYDQPLRRACWRTCATQTLWPCTTSSTPRPPSPSSSSSSPLTFPRWAASFSDVVKCANKVFPVSCADQS